MRKIHIKTKMPNPNPIHRFKKGNSGKPKGSVNKVNRMVKEVVSEVFNDLQTDPSAKKVKADLKSWARANPRDFYQIAAKLIPVQMEHSGEMGIIWNEIKKYGAEPETDDSP